MFTKLKEIFGFKKKPKYQAKNFTKSRINNNGHREVYDSSLNQWLLWSMIMDDTDYVVDFNSFEEVGYDKDDKGGYTLSNSSYEPKLNDFVETHVTESYTPSSYSPSSSSSSWGDSSSSYDSSSSSGGWD